jgi:threonine dehydrogenase-like Zn-dependent dehydrogenase
MYGAGDVRVEGVPDARLIEPTDALVRVARAAVCGSDLWPYKTMEHTDTGRRMGHEAVGIVEDVGADVQTLNAGDLVVMPFASPTAPASSATKGSTRRASTEGSSARRTSPEHRPKPFVSRWRTERSSSCRSTQTTR